jgi:hypothetical protein
MSEQWVTMKTAATSLNIHFSQISRWAARGVIRSKPNPFDKRSKLVELNEVREKLADFNATKEAGSSAIDDEHDGDDS